jgi:hypothetical protein
MRRVAKISILCFVVVVAIPAIFIGFCEIQNWRVKRAIGTDFHLLSQSISAESIQEALEHKFPAGTSRSEVVLFLRNRIAHNHRAFLSDDTLSEDGGEVFYMLECGAELGGRSRILLRFKFNPARDVLQTIYAEDHSISL